MCTRIAVVLWIGAVFYAGTGVGWAADRRVEHEFAPIEWCFQGKPIPETHWSPWLPLGAQQVTRLGFGFRFSPGTIAAKCPVKLTFTYDPANAKSGRDLPIRVKADMRSSDYNTFESAFGIALPNKLQVGFFGVSGLPDFLPWWDLPWDFWDLLGAVPIPEAGGINIPAMLESAKNNIGVNTSSTDALPLGTTASYHDQRSLISFDLTEAVEAYKNDLMIELFNRLSGALGPERMDDLLTIIQFAQDLTSEEEATEYLTDLCGDAVDKLAELASLALEGDPYFSVEGIRLRADVRCFIPGGKGSGVYTLYFTSSGQEQTINFRDITPFVTDGDVLKVVVDKIVYEFRLRQGLTAIVKLSLVPINLDTVEKVVSYTQAERNYCEADFKLEIPLSKSDDLIQSLRVHPGYISASVNWASPNVPLKGTVRTYDGQTLVKTTMESEFKNAHNVIVTDLAPSKSYRFTVECLTPDGLTISGGEKTATTVSSTFDRKDETEIDILDKNGQSTGTFELTHDSATADYTHIDFSWQTSMAGSTMVLISPSSDLAVNYIACAKKTDGSVSQGWVTRDATMSIGTSHQIRITGLEQGVTYYYNILSYKYEDDDPTKNPIVAVGKVGQVATKFIAPPQVKARVLYQNQPVPSLPVVLSNVDVPSSRVSVVTDATGTTPVLTLEKGKRYRFALQNHPYYLDAASSMVAVGTSASGALPDEVIQLTSRPSPGGHVYDAQGAPMSGASVKILNRSGYQTTTDSAGHYTFEGFNFAGDVIVEIAKASYATRHIPGRVRQCSLTRLFSADNCVLPSAIANLEITVKKLSGTPINGISVAVREADVTLATLTTNAQGKATLSHNFNDNNANAHNLTIAVQPPSGSKVLPVSTQASLIGGEQRRLEIDCPEDTQGPMIGTPLVTRPTPTSLLVALSASEDAVWSVEHTDPKGVKRTTSWTTSYARSGSASVPAGTAGKYRIKVLVKDRLGNASESAPVEYDIFGKEQWNLKVTAVEKTSATVTWNKYATPGEFKSYQITVTALSPGTGGPMGNTRRAFTVSDINTTTFKLDGLTPGLAHEATIAAELTISGTPVERAGAVFTTRSAPPQIKNLRLTPTIAGLKQDVKVAATVTDPDSRIRKLSIVCYRGKEEKTIYEAAYTLAVAIPFDESFSFDKPGKYKLSMSAADETGAVEATASFEVLAVEQPKIDFAKAPPEAVFTGDEAAFIVRLVNADKTAGAVTCAMNWGDGKTQQVKLGEAAGPKEIGEVTVAHKYLKAGSFTISAAASSKLSEPKATLTSDPITTAVEVRQYVPPTASLTDTTTNSRANQRTLHIMATRGSHAIESWSLGSGSGAETGSGDVNQDVTRFYPKKGNYTVELKVKDTRGNEVKSAVGIRIYEDTPMPPTGGTGLQQVQPGGTSIQDIQKTEQTTEDRKTTEEARAESLTGDLALLELKAGENIMSGRPATAEVSIRNDSREAVKGVGVTFYVASRRIDTQQCDLQPGQTHKITFKYTLSKPGNYTLSARIERPKNFKDTNTRNDAATQRVTAK